MKRTFILALLAISTFTSRAQLTSLSEDFEAACPLSTDFPSDWTEYNRYSSTVPQGQWSCAPGEGRTGNGMKCSGVWSTTYHLDTSWLFSPNLQLWTSYPDSVYLRFDTKTTAVDFGARLALLQRADTVLNIDSNVHGRFSDISDALTPTFGVGDSSGWVTHEINITSLKNSPLYVAFMYSSTTTTGSIWYLDNIRTSPISLRVPSVSKPALPLTITGNSSSSQITISYSTEASGLYHIAVYDMMGRMVHSEDITATLGAGTHQVTCRDLRPGMYLVKMGNGSVYSTVKTIIP